jgi:hypothetical protein
MTKTSVKLPKTIGAWTRSDSARIIDSSNIFDYMNGAGELYLAYGFDHLEVYEYRADQEENILVEVYVMHTSDDAFGLLSQDWSGDPVTLQSTPSLQSTPTVAPPYRALYGMGLLRLWADTIYARVMAYHESAASKEAVLSLGKMISANRKVPGQPGLLDRLPNTIDSDWKLRKDRIGFFRSHLVLNSLYYLSHDNILELGHSTEAVTAPYEKRYSDGTTKRVQVLFVKYATPERPGEALEGFHSTYLEDDAKGFEPVQTKKQMNFFKIEDGWLGYTLEGIGLAFVFECPNRETAETIMKNLNAGQ